MTLFSHLNQLTHEEKCQYFRYARQQYMKEQGVCFSKGITQKVHHETAKFVQKQLQQIAPEKEPTEKFTIYQAPSAAPCVIEQLIAEKAANPTNDRGIICIITDETEHLEKLGEVDLNSDNT